MDFNYLYSDYLETLNSLELQESEHLLLANIDQQKMALYNQGKSVKIYVMSSSKQPPSCTENSLGTPWGLHRICEKIGQGEREGMVFEGRLPIDLTAQECDREKQLRNLITSRILRLDGLEEGINRGGALDTFRRFVYIHGTNHEGNLGSPASSGCLQLSNYDVIELFGEVSVGAHLFIQKNFSKPSQIT